MFTFRQFVYFFRNLFTFLKICLLFSNLFTFLTLITFQKIEHKNINFVYIGNEEITSRAARDTANALRDFTAAVRGVAATSRDKSTQMTVIEQAQLVMTKSAMLVLDAQRGMSSPSDPNRMRKLSDSAKDVTEALGMTISCKFEFSRSKYFDLILV